MGEQRRPRRLIYCVDGTWCGPDGTSPSPPNTLTNVYQIYASIRDSRITDKRSEDGYYQEREYMHGIGSADGTRSLEKVKAGVAGEGCLPQIQKVYERCCMLDCNDEVWLFGFSRGAFVVRAVAGLLHYLQAISSAGEPQFTEDYKVALKVLQTMQKQGKLGKGQIHSFFSATTRRPPRIKFVGALDTVKAVSDRSLFNISLNDSIEHMRHALALHEDRKAMTPEYIFPDDRDMRGLGNRTFVQAWFCGTHIDIGGSSAHAGLSLYPLQWMLQESKALGLDLLFGGTYGGRATIDNPLKLVFPATENQSKKTELWSCTMENGLVVSMQDLRTVHESEQYQARYMVKLNKRHSLLWPRLTRNIFGVEGELKGWINFAPGGTVIHPSIYLLLDVSRNISLDTMEAKLQLRLEGWRGRTLGVHNGIPNLGFWDEQNSNITDRLGAIRVLVCGNTGVGKSTLINKVFGVSLAKASSRDRGEHNIREEIRCPDRPDLIVHDSGGFEAGAAAEMDIVKAFLVEKCTAMNIDDQLHVIWFCIESTSTRTKQYSTTELFKAVSQYARDVPIIIVATKKDELLAVEFQKHRALFKQMREPVDMDACDRYAEAQLQERATRITQEMLAVENGRLDAFVAISEDDCESIEELTNTTFQCISSERVRRAYIRSQVTRIDLKINLAMDEAMSIYRRTVRAAAAIAGLPLASTSTRISASVDVCRKILTCFGLPTVTGELAMQIIKSNAWDELGNSMILAFSELLAVGGVAASPFSFGATLVLTGAANVPLVVPTTARLLLVLATDLILILTRSFRQASIMNIGQPLAKDLESAARTYRPLAKEVHARVKMLIPRRNVTAPFRIDKIKVGFMEIIDEYKVKVIDDIVMPRAKQFAGRDDNDVVDGDSVADLCSDATLVNDANGMRKALEKMKI